MLAIPSCIVSQAAVTPQAMLSNALLFVGTLQETLRVQFRRWDGGTDGRQDRAACAPAQGRWDGRTPGSGACAPAQGRWDGRTVGSGCQCPTRDAGTDGRWDRSKPG